MRQQGDVLFNLAFAVESTGKSYPEITPHTFAFNTPEGMCLDCQGLGYQYGANLMQNREIMEYSITTLLRYLWQESMTPASLSALQVFLEAEKIDPYAPLKDIPVPKLQLILNGTPEDKW